MPKITCPSCQTSYELPQGTIDTKGRKVKCASCGTKWFAKPDGADVEETLPDSVSNTKQDASPIDAEFEDIKGEDITGDDISLHIPEQVEELPRKTARPINPLMRSSVGKSKLSMANRYEIREQKRTKRTNLLRPFSLVASFLVIAGIIHMREPIVRFQPDLASLYELGGYDVNLRGFEIRNIRSERVIENTGPVLIITGEVTNIRNVIAPAPKLRFGLKTNTNEEIYAWDHELSVPTIVPGGTTSFQSRLPSPPQLGRNISVQLTDS